MKKHLFSFKIKFSACFHLSSKQNVNRILFCAAKENVQESPFPEKSGGKHGESWLLPGRPVHLIALAVTSDGCPGAQCRGHYWANLVTSKRVIPWPPWSLRCDRLCPTPATLACSKIRMGCIIKEHINLLYQSLPYPSQTNSHSFIRPNDSNSLLLAQRAT